MIQINFHLKPSSSTIGLNIEEALNSNCVSCDPIDYLGGGGGRRGIVVVFGNIP